MKRLIGLVVALCVLFLLPLSGFPEEYSGRVVGVSDGDTLTLLVDGKRQVKVRLAEIDAPEGGQPYGHRAKQELSALAFNNAIHPDSQPTKDLSRLTKVTCHVIGGE